MTGTKQHNVSRRKVLKPSQRHRLRCHLRQRCTSRITGKDGLKRLKLIFIRLQSFECAIVTTVMPVTKYASCHGSSFFHKGPSIALLEKRGESCTTAAAATKPATLPRTGTGSDVRLTMGPIPKLMNKEPHNGANKSDQTHFLRTGPATAFFFNPFLCM